MKMITTRDRRVNTIVEEMQRKRDQEKERQAARTKHRQTWKELEKQGFAYSLDGRPAAMYDYDKGRFLYDVMPDGAWKDQRCFIIGGGESLREFDFSKLKNELVIGVNLAFKAIDCTINFAMDNDLYSWITTGRLGEETKEKFEDFRGFRVWLDSSGYNYPKGIFMLKNSEKPTLSRHMRDGINAKSNSGFGALNLAVCLGANPIYLLGFDMKGKDGRQSWWHKGYPSNQREGVYPVFIKDFKRITPELEERGFQVINLNRNSALRCFEFGKFEDIKSIKRPIITSYYTKGTAYETEVEQLRITLRRFNLDNDIEGILDKGSWHKNTYYKPKFIQKMMKKHPGRPVVFVDADAKIRRNPVLFNDFDCDFACHFKGETELLSGTLYFGNTRGSQYLINKWIEKDVLFPKTHMPQKNLRAVFDEQKDKIKWEALPVEYCTIFDSRSRHKINPVIEHYQLSRLYKSPTTSQYGYRMKQSLLEIQEFCKDKRICLIGNADSILRRKRDIDSFDVICRMNRGMPEGKEDFIGSRTDVLFLSTHMDGRNIEQSFDPRFVVWMTMCHRLASSWAMRNAIQNPKEDWQALFNQLKINPTTGMMSLNFILKHIEFKDLTIFGFDFFATKTWYNTKIDSGQKHSGKKEKTLFMKMIEGKKNVRLV